MIINIGRCFQLWRMNTGRVGTLPCPRGLWTGLGLCLDRQLWAERGRGRGAHLPRYRVGITGMWDGSVGVKAAVRCVGLNLDLSPPCQAFAGPETCPV